MRFLRITNGYPGLSDSALLVKAKVVVAAMTGNAHFATPTPTLTSVTGLITDFEEALEKAAAGDRQAGAVKREAKAAVINGLHLLGNYVLFTSANNEVVATSSGFSVSKTSEPRPDMHTPFGLFLKNGVNKGELKFGFAKVQGATAYLYEATPSPITADSVWEQSQGTICRKLYTGLESGKEYNCRVTAIGPKGQTVTSGIVSRVVL
jgi:hypothetical protein